MSVEEQPVATIDDVTIAVNEVVEEVEMLTLFQKNSVHIPPAVCCDVSEKTVVSNVCHIMSIYGVVGEECVEEHQCVPVDEKSVNFVVVE